MKYSSPFLHHRSIWSIGDLPRSDVAAVLDNARSLKRLSERGLSDAPLRGKNIAIVANTAPADTADSLERAAHALGARVTHLQASGSEAATGDGASTYRMLGRLYDAIDCNDMSADAVRRVEREAGVPVFNGLANIEHPARVIGELMEIQEHAGKPLEGLRLGFRGPLDTPRSEALLRLAARNGMTLSVEAAPAADTDFFIDAANDARWRCSGGGHPISDAESADDHRYVLQALLLMSLG